MKRTLLLLAACSHAPGNHVVDLDTKPGLSDLSRGPDGALWAEAERDRFLYRIDLDGGRGVAARAEPERSPAGATPAPAEKNDGAKVTEFPIDGVPDGLDIEAVDALPDGTFLLGTEGHGAADAAVWTATLASGRVTATLARRLDGRAQVGDNTGIEGLCGTRNAAVVGIEQPIEEGGKRFGQIAVLDLDGDPKDDRYLRVALTSDTGKIAALDCPGPDDVIAIERHFGISRIDRVDLGAGTATVLKDVTQLANGKNYEGVARLPDGRVALVNDNQYKGLDGPSQLTILPSL